MHGHLLLQQARGSADRRRVPTRRRTSGCRCRFVISRQVRRRTDQRPRLGGWRRRERLKARSSDTAPRRSASVGPRLGVVSRRRWTVRTTGSPSPSTPWASGAGLTALGRTAGRSSGEHLAPPPKKWCTSAGSMPRTGRHRGSWCPRNLPVTSAAATTRCMPSTARSRSAGVRPPATAAARPTSCAARTARTASSCGRSTALCRAPRRDAGVGVGGTGEVAARRSEHEVGEVVVRRRPKTGSLRLSVRAEECGDVFGNLTEVPVRSDGPPGRDGHR